MRQLSNDLGTGAISLSLVKIVSGQRDRESNSDELSKKQPCHAKLLPSYLSA